MRFKNSTLCWLLWIIVPAKLAARQCSVHEVPYLGPSFKEQSVMRSIYDSILKDNSGNTTYMTVNSYFQVGRKDGFIVTADPDGEVINSVKVIENLFSKTSYKNRVDIKGPFSKLVVDTSMRKYFFTSSGIGDSHMGTFVLVSNQKLDVLLVYEDLDGDGHSCLKKSDVPNLMKYAVELIEIIFKDDMKTSRIR